ncbi:hypothetical protein [Symbiopectobacterium purcellii]
MQELANVRLLPFFERVGHDAVMLLSALLEHLLHFSKHDSFIFTVSENTA